MKPFTCYFSQWQSAIASLLVLTSGVIQAAVLPYEQTLSNPCGRDLTSTQQPVYPAFQDSVSSAKAGTSASQRDVTNLEKVYKSLADISRFSKSRLPALQTDWTTSSNDLHPSYWTDTATQIDVITRHHHDVTLLLVYLQQAIREQQLYENGHLVPGLRSVESSLLDLLCPLDTALRQLQSPVTSDLDSIPPFLPDVSSNTRRYIRDAIVTNNIKIQLSFMGDYYRLLYQNMDQDGGY